MSIDKKRNAQPVVREQQRVQLVVVRDPDNAIMEVYSDNPNVEVVGMVVDRDLAYADPVYTVRYPNGIEEEVDRWTFTVTNDAETVRAFVMAPVLGAPVAAAAPTIVVATAEPPKRAVATPQNDPDDNPNCDYCKTAFVGYGLRKDFGRLACAKCDVAT